MLKPQRFTNRSLVFKTEGYWLAGVPLIRARWSGEPQMHADVRRFHAIVRSAVIPRETRPLATGPKDSKDKARLHAMSPEILGTLAVPSFQVRQGISPKQ